jgi:ribosomal protein S18 acetylase RimI-like enzyme
MKDSTQIRRATAADLEAMWEIFQAVVVTGDTLPFSEETGRDDLGAQWLAADRSTFVAEVGARVCGMYTLGANHRGRGSHVSSATYAVAPASQGKGIGRALVEHSLERAAEAGFVAMQFNYVVSTNTVAVALYQKLGFAIVGTLPRAFRHQRLGLVDAYVMYRFL